MTDIYEHEAIQKPKSEKQYDKYRGANIILLCTDLLHLSPLSVLYFLT